MIDSPKNETDNEEMLSVKGELVRLKEAYQTLSHRHTALFKLNQLSQECADLNRFYRQVHQIIASLMIAKNFYIVMYDQLLSTLEFVYHVDENDQAPIGVVEYQSLQGSLTHYVIESGEGFLATPNKLNQMMDSGKISCVGTVGMDWLGVPLMHNGFVIGVMAVQSYSEKTRYSEQDKELLNYTAQHIVSAMLRLQDHEQLQKAVDSRTKELMQQIREREKSELLQESLYRISELTNQLDIDIERFYGQIHNIIGQLINAKNFFIAKYEKDSDTINFVYYVDQNSNNTAKDFLPQKSSDLYTALVIRRAETCLFTYDEMYELYQQGITKAPQKETCSWLGVPLKYADNVIGVLVLQSYHSSVKYHKQDAELLNFVSHHVSIAIKRIEAAENERRAHDLLEQQVKLRTVALEEEIRQRKQAEKMLMHSASHDALTGLPNRSVFVDMLNHAIACLNRRPDMTFAVLFLDLDRFKMVNDSLGHHAGDILLKIVAKELTEIVRDKDTVARLGGDEFVILIEDLEDRTEAYEVAQRITYTLSQPFTLNNQPVFIGTSVGLLFSDERYQNADTMLRDADTAMYHAKDKGKGRFEEFDASMHQKIQDELMLEADLRKAIVNDEFTPFFQPIIKLGKQSLAGFEALVRWHSPTRGMVFPDNFIPLAEENGLVMDIDLHVIEKSCRQLKTWQELGLCKDQYISCNLFSGHFFNTRLPEDIQTILDKTSLAPEYLRIELTERVLLEENDVVLSNMETLNHMGIKLLLDDFGTGYSSLSYLHRFPINVLKIDRSFVCNAHMQSSNRAIIKTIVDLATNMQMATIAEGIECIEEARLLNNIGCNFAQGYYFAKPMPEEQIVSLLRSDNPIKSL